MVLPVMGFIQEKDFQSIFLVAKKEKNLTRHLEAQTYPLVSLLSLCHHQWLLNFSVFSFYFIFIFFFK